MSRTHNERGASLVIVLALVMFLSIVVPATLVLTLTGSRATVPVVRDRHAQYAATSAIDAAIQTARRLPDVGVPGGPCPQQTTTIDQMDVRVTCQSLLSSQGCYFLDRIVLYTAEVTKPGTATVIARSGAEVALRYEDDGDPRIEVLKWTSRAAPPSTTTLAPPCPTSTTSSTTTTTTTTVPTGSSTTTSSSTSTTTSTTSTTTSTTTTLPATTILAAWQTTAIEARQGNKWRANATLFVTSQAFVPLDKAQVAVKIETQNAGSTTWQVSTASFTGETNAGAVTFHSSDFNNGSNVAQVRFTVLSASWNAITRTWTTGGPVVEVPKT